MKPQLILGVLVCAIVNTCKEALDAVQSSFLFKILPDLGIMLCPKVNEKITGDYNYVFSDDILCEYSS